MACHRLCLDVKEAVPQAEMSDASGVTLIEVLALH